MKIIYLSNHFHHHQKPLADFLYEVNGDGYRFVEMNQELHISRKELGFKEYKVPYTIKYVGNEQFVDKLIMDADAVICGDASVDLLRNRVKAGKLIFRDDERRYKNIFKYLKYPIYTLHSHIFNRGYLLSASAYGARDYVLSGMDPQRCFKWGYFIEIKEQENLSMFIKNKRKFAEEKYNGYTSILWVGRMIAWKHPELVIEVARKLKNDFLDFHINMIGRGHMKNKLLKLIQKYGLSQYVTLHDSKGQDEVRDYMEKSEIYLFTSDEGEGWGVVLSEAMASACVPVASHAAGATPALVKDGENGYIFTSKSIDSLYEKLKKLILENNLRCKMAESAYKTMLNVWNPLIAGKNLMALIESILKGGGTPIVEGPCSQAIIMNHTNYKKYK